jgi:hypothetical protein
MMLVILMLLQPIFVPATTMIAIRGPNYVVLASDSLMTGTLKDQKTAVSGCKIQQIKNVFVGVAGTFAGDTGFNAYNLARDAIMQGGNIKQIADRFEQAVHGVFKTFVEDLRRENPVYFQKYCNNKDCLQVVFIVVEDGTSKLAMRCFRVTTPSGKSVVVESADNHDCPGDCSEAAVVLLGDHDNADALIGQTPQFWKVKGIYAGIDEAIGAEIKAHPHDVGLPISMLTIDKSGPHWQPGHQGLCPDVN